MKKNTQILIGVAVFAVVATGAYMLAGGDLFQGRMRIFHGKGPSRPTYISSTPLCLTPEQYNKKYPPVESNPPVGSTNTATTTTVPGRPTTPTVTTGRPGTGAQKDGGGATTTTATSGGTTNTTGTPIIINPSAGTGIGSTGGTVAKGNTGTTSTGSGSYSSPAGKGEKGPATPDGKGSSINPDFVCPEGTMTDYPALNDLCKSKKQKNCFAATKPDNSSKEDAMCKALIPQYSGACPNDNQCKQYAEWLKAETYTGNMDKNGLSTEDSATCKWFGK